MSDPKFTPGPWRITPGLGPYGILPVETIDSEIITCVVGIADAQLIAAAPELYKALQACVDALGPMMPTRESMAAYRAAQLALAKARGEMP